MPDRPDIHVPGRKFAFFGILDVFLHPDLKGETNKEVWLARFLVLVCLITQLTFWTSRRFPANFMLV